MSLKNYIRIFIFAIGLFLAEPSLAANYWVNNPTLCPTDAYSQSCVGGQKVCGVNASNVVSCANTASFTAPVASTVTSGSVNANGGYLFDCYAQDATAPYCDNNGGSTSGLYSCFQKTACNSARVATVCTAGVWETATCNTSMCLPGYRNCNADADCSDVNEHDTDSCTTAGGQPGTYSACVCNAISATLKLSYDSAIGPYLKNSAIANPLLSIFSDGSLVIGSTTQPTTTKFSLHDSNLFINDSAITSGTPNAAITKGYLDSALSAYSSSNSMWQLSGNNLFASSTAWNVGIGTNNPGAKLDIYSTPVSNALFVTNASESAFKFFLKNNGTSNGTSVSAFDLGLTYNSTPNSFISFFRGSSSVGGFLTFNTSDAAAGVERMRIDSTGQIGIGTTTPSSALDIFSKVHITSNGTVYNTDNGRYLDMTGVLTDSLKVSGDIYTTAGEFKSDAAGINYMLGSLGIGTTTPGAKLEVYNGNSKFWHGGTTEYTLFASNNEINHFNAAGTGATLYLQYGSNAATNIGKGALFIGGNNGSVGIGTTNPTLKLDVAANAFNPPASSGTANNGFMRIGYSDRTWAGSELNIGIINSGSYPVWFQSQNPTALGTYRDILLNPNGGNIGIATTTPDAKLQVAGSFHVSGALNSVVLDKLTGTGNRVVMADASGSLYATSSSNALPSGTAGQTLRHDGTNWLANSFLYNNGTYIGIGTTVPRATLEVGANDGVNASIVAGNIIEVAGLSEVAQGADITITGGTLVSGGPTAKNGKGYWDITTFPSTITFNTRGWWTYAGMSFTAANVHNFPAGGGNKLPANFLVEASSDGTAWVTVENVTGYTSALYYKNNVYGGSGKYIRITATAPQAGETTAKIANVQITNTQRAGKNPFSLSAEGSAVFLGGNVGLSNNNPGSLLTVGSGASTLNLTSGGAIYNSDSLRWLRFDNLLTDSLKVQGNIYTTAGLFKSDAASGYNYMLSNLGIGTNNPVYAKLQVAGDIAVDSGNRISPIAADIGAAYLKYDTAITDARFMLNGYYGLRFDTAGGTRMVIKQTGEVGIATTSPDAKLNVNGATHILGAFSSFVIDKLATDGAGTVMADASGALYTTQTSGLGRFRAVTASFNGSQGGYTGVNAKCNTAYPGSHVCTSAEMLNTINTGHTADVPNTTGMWISSGPPAYFANVNDCLGWTDTASYGTIWIKSTADGYGSIGLCNGTGYPIACCK